MPKPLSSPDGEPINSVFEADANDALKDAGPASQDNPVAIGAAFLSAVTSKGGPKVDVLVELVTPESRHSWGDFSEVAEGWRTAA